MITKFLFNKKLWKIGINIITKKYRKKVVILKYIVKNNKGGIKLSNKENP